MPTVALVAQAVPANISYDSGASTLASDSDGAAFPIQAMAPSPTFAVTPPAVSAEATNEVQLNFSNLTPGQTVRVDIFVDLDGDGAVDGGEVLVKSFRLTDGGQSVIGGVRNLSVPGDEDGSADGAITSVVNLRAEEEVALRAGSYVFVVSPEPAGFDPLTARFTVAPPAHGQRVVGQVTSGGAPVPYALAVLGVSEADGLVAAGLSDANGRFNLPCRPGTYWVGAIGDGYLLDTAAAATVTVGTGATVTNDVALVPATQTISGQVTDASSAAGIAGVEVVVESTNGLVTICYTDASGQFVANVSAASEMWDVTGSPADAGRLGYTILEFGQGHGPESPAAIYTGGGSTSGVAIAWTTANALVYGQVTDGGGSALAHYPVAANTGMAGVAGHSRADGRYALGVEGEGGFVGAASVQHDGTMYYGGENWLWLSADQALMMDLGVAAATTRVSGRVVDEAGSPIADMRLTMGSDDGAYLEGSTDAVGQFAFTLFAGNWSLQLDWTEAQARKLFAPNFSITVVDGADQTNVVYVVVRANRLITGTVQDQGGQPVPNLTVRAWGYFMETNYASTLTATDANGAYELAVADGEWSVNPDCGQLAALCFCEGETRELTVNATNAEAAFVVAPIAVRTRMPDGFLNLSYDWVLVGACPSCAYGWSVVSNSLPGGMTMDGSGWLYGTPTEGGWFEFTVRLDGACTVEQQVSLFISTEVGPNLVPVALDGPAAADLLASIAYSYTVTNRGTEAASGGWTDRLYLSADNEFSADDQLLGGVTVYEYVPRDGSYSRSVQVSLPCFRPGDYQLLLVVDALETLAEGNETNNVLAAPFQLQAGAVADLQPIALDAPGAAQPQEMVELKWVGTNAGSGSVPVGWVDRLYLSTDSSLDANDVELCFTWGTCGAWASSGLAAGQTYTNSMWTQLPALPPGSYFVIVHLDADTDVCEAERANNIRAWPLTLVGQADLQPLGMTGPTEFIAGRVIELTTTVTNHGPATAPGNWVDEVYFSTDANWNPSEDDYLGFASYEADVASGTTYTSRLTVQLPCVPPGEYYLIFVADSYSTVLEGDESNNILAVPASIVDWVDLAPVELSAPGTVFPRETIQLTWAVTNQGSLPADAQWTDRIYLSTQAGWNEQAIELGNVQCQFCSGYEWNELVAGGATYTQALVHAQLPNAPAGDYFLVLRVGPDSSLCESTIANNDLALPIRMAAAGDLLAADLSAPGAAAAGESIAVSFAITNLGPETAHPSWQDTLYLSTNNAVYDAGDIFLLEVSRTEAVLANAGYGIVTNVSLPVLPGGDYFLILLADGRGALGEGSETNNELALPLTLLNADLVPMSLVAPSRAAGRQNIVVSWVVANSGGGLAAGSWNDRLYLSTDNAWDAADSALEYYWHAGFIPASGTYTQSWSMDLPAAASGDYYLVLRADAGNALLEADETNNDLAVPLTLANADLGVTDFSALTPLWAVAATASSEGSVTYAASKALGSPDATSCYNSTNGWIPELWSTNSEWLEVSFGDPTSAVGLVVRELNGSGFITRVDLVAADDTAYPVWSGTDRTSCQDWFTLRFAPPPYLVKGARVYTTSVGNEQIDAVGLLTELPATLSALSQQEVLLHWQVVNSGVGATPRSWYDRVYLSTNAVWEPDDLELTSYQRSEMLPAGSQQPDTRAIRLPQVMAGDYWILLRADATDVLEEDNEQNNVAALQLFLAPPPDLVITELTAPMGLCSQETIPVSWIVANHGSNVTQVSWWDRLYLSTNDTWSADDLLLFSEAWHQPIPAGGAYTNNRAIVLPTWPAGTYYLLLRADAGDHVFEASEANNTRVLPLEIGNPDLVPVLFAMPDPVLATQRQPQVTVSWTVANRGTCTAQPNWRDTLYLSSDAIWDAEDQAVATYQQSAAVAGDGQYTATVDVVLPADSYGSFFFIVRVDGQASLFESSDANNVTNRAFNIVLAPVPDLVVTNVLGPLESVSGQPVQVSWVISNQGPATAVGPWVEAVYLAGSPDDPQPLAVGSFAFSGLLGPGEAVVRAQRVPVPTTLSGSVWPVVRTDSADNVYEREGESNNVAVALLPIEMRLQPFPNLQVVFVNAPPTAHSSSQVVIEWGVTNAGTGGTTVGTWYDQVFLSADAVFDPLTDPAFPAVANPSYLDVGESYVSSTAVTLPRGVEGAFYFFVKTDSLNYLNEHIDEDDNLRIGGPVQVQLTPPPDLQVFSVSAPVQALSGQPVPISWTITNTGTGRTLESGWWDGIYVSHTNELDGDAIWLGRARREGALEAGESYSVNNFSATLPVGYTGDSYFLIAADVYSQVYEHVYEANNSGTTPRTTEVRLTPPPDLEVTRVDAPPAATAGRTLTVSYRVANYGSTATPNSWWEDRFYLSTNAYLTAPSDLLLAKQTHWGALDLGAEYAAAFNVTLPDTLAGTFYAFIVTDFGNVVFELDKANNVSSDPEPIVILSQPPDLVVTHVLAPPTANAGGAVLVSWTVGNQGLGDSARTAWYDRVVLSADTVVGNRDDLALLTLAHDGLLDAGATYTVAQRLATLPISVAPGLYRLFVITDVIGQVYEGTNEHNNASAPLTLTVTRDTADLEVVRVDAPIHAESADAITVTWVVRNAGSVDPNVTYWSDALFLSADTEFNAGDLLLGARQSPSSLMPGTAYTNSHTVILPEDLQGDFYLILMADAEGRVLEPGARENNLGSTLQPMAVTLHPVPDLTLTEVDAPTEAFSGQPLAVSWTVRNQGDGPAVNGWFDTVYLSLDQFFDPQSDLYLGYSHRSTGLESGLEVERTATFNLPGGLSGLFYVFVSTDANNHVRERGAENNNVRFDPVALQVRLLPPADLVVGPITVPANGVPGRNAALTYTVYNQGENAARGAWLDSLYLSTDNQWDLGDLMLGRVWHRGDVPAGSNYTASFTGPLPGVLPGEYVVLLRSDILNNLAESIETNNLGASLDRMQLDAEALLLGVETTGDLALGQAAYYRFEAPEGQTIRLALDGAPEGVGNELYVRHGQMPSRNRFDFAANEPFVTDPTLILPIEVAGTYYVLAYAATAPTAFSLRADILPFSVSEVRPGAAGNRGQVTLRIRGALFTRETEFQVLCPGLPPLSAVEVAVLDSATAVTTFNLFGAPTGSCTLRAVLPGDPDLIAELPDALFIQEGIGPRMEMVFEGDLTIRPNRVTTFRLAYANTGDADTGAPLIIAYSASGRPIGFGSDDLRTNALHILGLNSSWPMTTLPPQALHSLMMHVETAAGGSTVGLRAYAVLPDNTTPVTDDEWLGIEAAVRPGDLTEAQWNVFWSNLRLRIGETWGDYVTFLNRLAADLAGTGIPPRDVRALMAAMYAADPDYRASSTLIGRVLDSVSGMPRAGVDIGAYRLDGSRYRLGGFTQTDPEGGFELRFLPPGEYEMALLTGGFDQDQDGLADAAPPSLTLTRDADLTGLVLLVLPLAPAVEALNDDNAAVALDSAGVPQIAWSRAGHVWHAWHDGQQWIEAQPVSEAPGSNLSLAAAPNLLDGTDAGLIAVWEQGAENAAEIFYAVGRPVLEGGYQWSRPVQLTQDSIRDGAPALLVNDRGQALIAYLKRDAEIRDDTDIYYALVDVASGTLEWQGQVAPIRLASDGGGLRFSYVKQWGPYQAFGTSFKSGVDLGVEGKVSGCSASASGSAKGTASFRLPGFGGFDFEGNGALAVNWEAHKRRCEWLLKGAQLDAGVQGTFVWKDGLVECLQAMGPAGVAASKGIRLAVGAVHRFTPLRVENGVNFVFGIEMGDLRWTRVPPIPAWVAPDYIGTMDLNVGLGPYAKLTQRSVEDVELSLSGNIMGKTGLLPSFQAKELTGVVQLNARVREYGFSGSWTITLLGGEEGAQPAATEGAAPPEVPGGLVMTYDPAAVVGTTNVYGPNALRADVADDVYRDSTPVLLRHADGRLAAVWSRDEDPAGPDHSRLYVAEFDGAQWTAPVAVPASGGWHSGLGAAIDSLEQRLVVWSSADGSGLGAGTTFEELQAVRDSADLFWSVQTGGSWTPPVRLAFTPGPDGDMDLARIGTGEVLATWTYRGADEVTHLLSARWDGSAWSAPVELAAGDLAGPRVAWVGAVPTVFWTLDTDPDPDVESTSLRFRRYIGTWQPEQVFDPAQLSTAPAGIAALGTPASAGGILPAVPESCCECKQMREISLGSGECISGTDFDEATCTRITFYEPCVQNPKDPNDIIGPPGFGDDRWVPSTSVLAYTIRFENMTNAAAPAQEVIITHPLDPDLDWRTFRVGNFGLGTLVITVPTNRAFYSERLDLTESRGFYVDVVAGIDISQGEAYWRFTTIDPATGETPTDALVGFLPPNTNAPAGEGYVTYTIRPRGDAPTGRRIDAVATIVFDTEAPLGTPPIFNTVDASLPSSLVVPLLAATSDPVFVVAWMGADETGGSALAGYDIYVSDNGGPFQLWLGNTTLSEAPYSGLEGHTYAFYSLARDNAGNLEDPPETADAQIAVTAPNLAPVLVVPETLTVFEHDTLTATNFASDADVPAQGLSFSLAPGTPDGVSIDSVTGVLTWTPGEGHGPATHMIFVTVTDDGSPSLSATEAFLVNVVEVNQAPELPPLPELELDEMETFTLNLVATDPDLPANGLSFALEAGPAGLTVGTSGQLDWTPNEAQGPGNFSATVRVMDNGSPSLSATQTFNLAVREVNRPPQLEPVPDQIANVLSVLVVTNVAGDPDLPANSLSLSLDADAPAGAGILPELGLFYWTPPLELAPSTNAIAVIVTDDGQPPLSATNRFVVVVPHYCLLQAHTTAVVAGETGQVAITLQTSARVASVEFQVLAPEGNLADWVFRPNAAVPFTNVLQTAQTDGLTVRALVDAPDALTGELELGQVEFVTSASQPSTFLSLQLRSATATEPAGATVPWMILRPGRVVIVAVEPLVELPRATNAFSQLLLYGRVGQGYQVEALPHWNGATWSPVWQGTLTNVVQPIPGTSFTNGMRFFRAITWP